MEKTAGIFPFSTEKSESRTEWLHTVFGNNAKGNHGNYSEHQVQNCM